MSLGKRAWEEINVLVYSTENSESMVIENTLEDALNIDSVFSFSDYDDLYDFCKKNNDKNTIMFIELIDENVNYQNHYEQIKKLISKKGYNCYLVPLYNDNTKFSASVLQNKEIESTLMIIDKEKFLSKEISSFVEQLWDSFIEKYKKSIISDDVLNTYIQMTNKYEENRVFIERINNLLVSNANLNWMNKIKIELSAISLLMEKHFPDVLESQEKLHSFIEALLKVPNVFSINELYSNLNIEESIFQTSKLLWGLHERGDLEASILNFEMPKGRRKTYIEKMLYANKSEIVSISHTEKRKKAV